VTKQEKKIAVIREENKIHLLKFEEWLTDKGFAKKTIDSHVSNVSFYINHCLVYDEPQSVTSGCDNGNLNYFFGYWFNKKASWASGSHIRRNAASFKKFYTFLLEKSVIKQSDYDELCETIKLDMSEWLEIIAEVKE